MPKHYRPARRFGDELLLYMERKRREMLPNTSPGQELSEYFKYLCLYSGKICIYKDVFPREPKKKVQGYHQIYSHMKDIMFPQHEKLIDVFMGIRAHDRKVKKAKAKKQMELAIHLMNWNLIVKSKSIPPITSFCSMEK